MIRAMAAPPAARRLYSDRGAPTGPVLSPDDPRYGHAADRRRLIPTAAPTGPVLHPMTLATGGSLVRRR